MSRAKNSIKRKQRGVPRSHQQRDAWDVDRACFGVGMVKVKEKLGLPEWIPRLELWGRRRRGAEARTGVGALSGFNARAEPVEKEPAQRPPAQILSCPGTAPRTCLMSYSFWSECNLCTRKLHKSLVFNFKCSGECAVISHSGFNLHLSLFKYLFIFREKERKGEREGEKHQMCKRYIDQVPLARPQLGTWPATQACALTKDRTSDLSVHRLPLNPLSHTSQS